MKEVVVVEPHKVEVREVEIPELANEDEVLIQMKSAGVCGSDHHIYHGLNPCSTYPRIPGHENAGIVKKIAKNVTNVKVGDHVIVDLISTCGECYQCKIGRKNVCEHVKVRGSGADGGWREYFTAPANEVYKINESVKWEDAALVEPYAIGAHSTTRGRVVPEDVEQEQLVLLYCRHVKQKDVRQLFVVILMILHWKEQKAMEQIMSLILRQRTLLQEYRKLRTIKELLLHLILHAFQGH